MSGERRIVPDPQTQRRQAQASDPGHSAWVSANAGSGKTYVLAIRVIRLLLAGFRPSELLCLTFTRAAAAEMSNRVFSILGQWAAEDDGKLAESLESVLGRKASTEEATRARQLFALALDTPGGLKIQTIHAFCESLLRQFPLEANLPAHFDLLEDRRQRELVAIARQETELIASGIRAGKPDPALASAYRTMLDLAGGNATATAIEAFIGGGSGSGVSGIRDREEITASFDPLWRMADLDRSESAETLIARQAKSILEMAGKLSPLCEALAAKKGKMAEKAIAEISRLRSSGNPGEILETCTLLFETTKGERRKYLISETFENSHSAEMADFNALKDRHFAFRDQRETHDTLRASEALFVFGLSVLERYSNMKLERGLLDFSDMIDKAAHLLNRKDIGPWVQYKLDKGISHVLVDEAQDTSPQQWQVINAITGEFFAGKGADERNRTLFVVGDEKQSIFSFQGADPAEFDRQQKNLARRSKDAGRPYLPVGLNLSFRSTTEVLSAVDQVFSDPANHRGLSRSGANDPHTAHRKDDPGEVQLWPPIVKPEKNRAKDWFEPVDLPGEAERELARRIASTIRQWLDEGRQLPGMKRPLRHGDFLILLRRRDRFAVAMIQELRRSGLRSAGADRLMLAEHIVSEDLIALCRFAIAASDDLSLAGLLKSPLFAFDEEDLFRLAHGRGDSSLWQAMCVAADGEGGPAGFVARLKEAVEVLGRIRHEAGHRGLFEFLAWVYSEFELRSRYHQRLGREAEDVLDGFLEAAMAHDDTAMPGLRGFVETMLAGHIELKRDVDMNSDEIRVITVHSSKGLEAPVVFLVDPGTVAVHSNHLPVLVPVENGRGTRVAVWRGVAGAKPSLLEEPVQAICDAREEEYRRLLYVGMTRAADMLVLCGYVSSSMKEEHWYSMAERALEAAGQENGKPSDGRLITETDADGLVVCKRWVVDRGTAPAKLAQSTAPATDRPVQAGLPPWLSRISAERPAPRPVSPTGIADMLGVEDNPPAFARGAGLGAMQRGIAVHDLLQILPDMPATERRRTIAAYFSGAGRRIPSEMREEISLQVENVLGDARLQAMFAPGSRAEVAMTGEVRIGGRVHAVLGKADRIADDGRVVLIADYKTGSAIPEKAGDAPFSYLVQMALYRALVRQAMPDRQLRQYIIWTSGPVIHELDDALLDKTMETLAADH